MDSLYLKAGIIGITPQITVAGDIRSNPTHISAAVGRSSTSTSTAISTEKPSISVSTPQQRTAPWGFPFKYPFKSLWPGGRSRYDAVAVDDAISVEEKDEEQEGAATNERNENWVLKILHVRSLWKEETKRRVGETVDEGNDAVKNESDERNEVSGDDEECDVCKVVDDDENKIELDKYTFSKLLRRVSLPEARLYAKLSYLGSLAYSIPGIKPGNLLKKHGLRFVTSSLEKKAELALKAEKEKVSDEFEKTEEQPKEEDVVKCKEEKSDANQISANAAYHIASSAASYFHTRTMSILPFKSLKTNTNGDKSEGGSNAGMMNAEVASLMATTDSVTAVVAAKEEVKQAVADDLNSIRSSPCEWFICDCDDEQSSTRFFVIQGSESLASWQANLLFEPIDFEGLDVIVHRGIYEAAKGIYAQMLPEVQAHLKQHGGRATFRFTGHSLGGSLSLLVNLMLLIRGEVPRSSLLPVVTFGAPSIMCGGDRLLRKLGLPRSHLQAITMHRDIVPRAFSCNYPNSVAELLKAVNGNFRNHPCLNNQSTLYAPMGEFLILQPDDKLSPNHHLLPSGSGLYILTSPVQDASEAEKQTRAAQAVFLNSPHPLEILSDRSAYGSEGAIQRDHDMDSYLKSVRSVIRQELNRMRKTRREHRRRVWWPLVAPHSINKAGGDVVVAGPAGQGQFNFARVLQTGRESLGRFTRLVSSQHMHLLVVFLLPARLLIVGAYSVIGLRVH